MINARHVHFKDTLINLILYGNFFLLIVIIYKCKLAFIRSKENSTLEVIEVKVSNISYLQNGEIICIVFLFFLQAYSKNSPSFHDKDRLVLLTHTTHSLMQA